MPSCIARPPVTLDEWLAVIDNCATAAGGAAWQTLALMGVLVVVAFLLAALVGAALWRMAK